MGRPLSALSSALGLALVGCSGPAPPTDTGINSTAVFAPPGGCAGTAEGCPCSSVGLTTSCGQVARRSRDYVACSEGLMTCQPSGRWSGCVGDGIATRTVATGAALHSASLAVSSAACAGNPCDPYCRSYDDTPVGTDAGAGLSVVDGGLGLAAADAGTSSTCTGLSTMANVAMTVTSISPVVTSPPTTTFSTSLLPAGCWSGALAPLWGVSRYDLAAIGASGTYAHVVPVPADVSVTTYAGSFSAAATVSVKVAVVDTSAAPSGYNAASFVGTYDSVEAAPALVYPYDQTVFPLGLSAPLLMWKRTGASAAKAVQIVLKYPAASATPTFSWTGIVAEGSQRYQIPQSVWTAFDQTAKGSTGRIELRRIDSANKRQAPVSVDVQFSTANLTGRIYYTSYEAAADVKRVLPSGIAAPVTAFTPPRAANCGVCHSMSASGNKFLTSSQNAAAANGVNTFAVSNVATNGSLEALTAGPAGGGDSRGLSFAPVTRTGTFALLGNNWWGNVANGSSATTPGAAGPAYKIYSLPTVAAAATDVSNAGFGGSGNAWGLGGASPIQMYTPSFSPDNARLLYVNADTTADAAGATAKARQGISTLLFDEVAKKFSSRKLLVNSTSTGSPASSYIRWPTWEVDSRSVMFQTSPTTVDDGFNWYAGMLPSGCCGGIKVQGKLWSFDAGPVGGTPTAPVALAKLNAGLGASSPFGTDDRDRNYQPTMLGVTAGGFRWAVFTSVRAYGNLINNAAGALSTNTNKLWVAAIDDAASTTTDRSHPPFFLPNQNAASGMLNERGYWTLDACKAPDVAASTCSSNEECCGFNATTPASSTAECRVDAPLASPPTFHCKSTSTAVCRAEGMSCGSDGSCCGFPTTRCVSGTCQTPPPVATYSVATFTRDFTAPCRPDQGLVWRFFDYKTQFPTSAGSSIALSAATATTAAGLATAKRVTLATQTSTNASFLGADVSAAFAADSPAIRSAEWLRIFMAFTPTTDTNYTPYLTDWRQAYDCVDAE